MKEEDLDSELEAEGERKISEKKEKNVSQSCQNSSPTHEKIG